MNRILFVDDQPEILRGLKRVLGVEDHKLNIEFAMSGKEALNLMSKSHFDVIVSDMHMPEMNGGELLGMVKERYPEIVRIILSGLSEKEVILRSLNCAHQFLAKPCNTETLRYTIERACKLRDCLRIEELKKVVTRIKDMPSLPRLYNLIAAEAQIPDASIKRVGEILSQEVLMSTKILRLVNSPFFNLQQEIKVPQHAAAYLGIDKLNAFVLSIHTFSAFIEDAELCGFSLAKMWKHSLRTSILARDIASVEMVDEKTVEEAVIAGMLHDIGKLILLKVPKQYKQVKDFIERTGCDPVEAAYAVMKISHAELGAYVLRLWGFPDHIVEPVAFHHNPSKLLENTFIIPSESSNKDTGKIESGDEYLKSPSVKILSKELTVLTAVHVANSLLMQKSKSLDTTDFPYIDMHYLSRLNLTDKLPAWVELCKNVMQQEVISCF